MYLIIIIIGIIITIVIGIITKIIISLMNTLNFLYCPYSEHISQIREHLSLALYCRKYILKVKCIV